MAVAGIMAFLVVAIAYQLVLTCRQLRGLRRLRALVRDTATTPVAELRPGPVAVEGRAVAVGSALVSPLQGETCLAHDSVVERLQKQSKQDREWTDWRTIHRDYRCAALAVDDGTGRTLVQLSQARLELPAPTSGELGPSGQRPVDGTPAARAMALAKEDRRLGVRWREACLREGERLFVFGTWSGSELRSETDLALVVSTLGREGALRELAGPLRSTALAGAGLVLAILFCGAGAVLGVLNALGAPG